VPEERVHDRVGSRHVIEQHALDAVGGVVDHEKGKGVFVTGEERPFPAQRQGALATLRVADFHLADSGIAGGGEPARETVGEPAGDVGDDGARVLELLVNEGRRGHQRDAADR